MSTVFQPLLRNMKLGNFVLPNRIVFGSHPTNFAWDNCFTDRHIAYYRERAKGGAGMVVLEEFLVHSSDLPYEKALFGWDPRIVEGCRRIADAVHQYGAVAVAQLNHSGMQSEGSTGMRELWAPSAVPDVISREVPKVMEMRDIQAVVAGFSIVAEHAVEGGLDGVEVNAAQYSLVRQFLSPLTNLRSDQYGGSLENRLRFPAEVLRAVRASIGTGRLLGLRLCGDEFAPWGGLGPADAEEIAGLLAGLDVLDYIVVAVGSLYTLHLSPASFYSEPGLAVEAAARIKEAAGLPVFAEGRLHRPEFAAKLVNDGLVDGIYMNRALICDPQLPAKLSRMAGTGPRGCLSCNQGCQVRHSMGRPLSCTVNPSAGLEYRDEASPSRPALKAKQVLVIGGGPAGMEAARTAAGRGHHVSLWETAPVLGGAMASNDGIAEIAGILGTWAKELEECGVQVHTGKRAEADAIIKAAPDVLVLATGAVQTLPALSAQECAACSAREAALRKDCHDKRLLFWDEIGDQAAGRTMEMLLAQGNAILYVTPHLFVGSKMAGTRELIPWNQRCLGRLDKVFTSSSLLSVEGGQAVISCRFSGRRELLGNIQFLIYNTWPKPADILYQTLKDHIREIHRVGDCLAPRGIGAARRDGYQLGLNI